ncbi:homocysteine S-methyltransferase YbgG isoform X2 [Nematostella vectensis]|uniref:homocysteine S-methyltransferase YbgG isoform X2 n=1 Tax=Nematostella vectensis TaxID=45351 RepID=UPI0020774149|nr:homocysteine S-methyltransferase YbgG isoform X2 [Nematostella vectensis]
MDSNYRVLDGGLAYLLAERGFKIDGDPLWSARVLVENPEAVKQVHKSFLTHGSDIITTATYQASISGFCKHLGVTADEARKLIQRGVHIARESVDEFWDKHSNSVCSNDRIKPQVAGSVCPYGACQSDGSEYHGNYVDTMTIKNLMDWHRPQIQALVETGLDLLAFETIPAQKEGEALVQLLKEFPGTKAWLSYSCKDGSHTSHNEDFVSAIMAAVADSEQSLIRRLKPKTTLPIVIYPNKGEEWIDRRWQDTGNVPPVVSYLDEWIDSGAQWIGGCCRTSLTDISETRAAIARRTSKPGIG